MMERATLQVLAELAEIGLPEAVDVHVAAFDPLLRPVLRRCVRRAIAEAVATAPDKADSGANEHLLYLAFVLRHPGCPRQLHASDELAVLDAYRTLSAPFTGIPADQARRPRPGIYRANADPNPEPAPTVPRRTTRRFWPLTSPVVTLLLATVIGVVFRYAAPYFVPSAEERFRRTAFGRSLDEPLTDYISEVGHGKDGEARARLLVPEVERQIGSEAFTNLARAVDLVPQAVLSTSSSTDSAAAPLFDELNALNAQLSERKVPALLLGYAQGGALSRAVWITSYFVERRTELTLNGQSLRTAWGRRLDGLNLVDDALYKLEAEDWVVLSLERVEEDLVQMLLGSMASGAPLGPREYHPTDTSTRAAQARILGPLLAEEMEARAQITPEAAERAYRALAARNGAALDLRGKGYALEATSRLQLPPWLVRRMLRTKATRPADAPLIEELLRTNERMSVYRQSIAPAVDELALLEEEEFAGRLFYEKNLADAEVPRALAIGLTKGMRAVASAELALLTRAQSCPRLALWRVASMAYQPLSAGDYAVGALLVHALFRRLPIPGTPRAGTLDPDDDALAAALEAVMRMPPERLRDAADQAYAELFGRPPPVLTRKALP